MMLVVGAPAREPVTALSQVLVLLTASPVATPVR